MSARAARASRPLLLASAGIGVVGVSYGMARYGFGLLAPDIRSEFGLGNRSIGLLAAASYVAYVVTSVIAGALTVRIGPRATVAAGGACAVAGMLVAGTAGRPGTLFAGLLVAGASAGLVFPPFSDVVAGALPAERRGRVLAAISSGTGWGVALAAPIALLVGGSWRAAWLLYAAVAALATVWALTVVPARAHPGAGGEVVRLSVRWFFCPRSSPLLTGALLVGLSSSVFWTFAVEHLQRPGGVSAAESQIVLAVAGLASVAGTAGADAVRRLGARAAFALAAVAQAVALLLLGLAPGTVATGLAAAVFFGAAYNTLVAVEVIWSAQVFATRPSAGLAAVLVMNAVGLLAGGPLFGAVADAAGLALAFDAAAVVVLGAAAFAPRTDLGVSRAAAPRGAPPPRAPRRPA